MSNFCKILSCLKNTNPNYKKRKAAKSGSQNIGEIDTMLLPTFCYTRFGIRWVAELYFYPVMRCGLKTTE